MNNKAQIVWYILLAFIVVIVVAVIGFFVWYGFKQAFTDGTETITVKTKWTKIVDGTENYRITSVNGQTFVISDSWLHGQFESASVYANMEEGKTYKIRTQGFRYGFFSDFKKITETTEI